MLRCLSYLRIKMSFFNVESTRINKIELEFLLTEGIFLASWLSNPETQNSREKNRISKWAISYLCVEYQQSAMVTGKQTDFRNVYSDNNLMKGVLNVGECFGFYTQYVKNDDNKTGNNTVAINGIFTLHRNGTGASTWTK